jgi:hypothetical protein
VRAIKKIFVGLGAAGGFYCCIELARVIKYYIDNVKLLHCFGFEYFLIGIGIAWIVVSAIDDLFLKSDLLGSEE